MKSVLRYPGAKWSISSWIIGFFPEHHSYLEPFFGSGAVLLNKDRSNIETINDLDQDVINLFDCIRKDPERLANEIYFTPYARAVYENTYNAEYGTDPYERAMQFLVRCNMVFGHKTSVKVGWKNDVSGREKAYAAKNWVELPDVVLETAERLRGVQIECRPATELITRFNSSDVLIYCDPPYVLSTRAGKQYQCEMTDDDHMELLDVLKKHRGPVLVSGYPSELYDRELADWHRETNITRNQLAQQKQEVLWMNFEPMCQEKLF